MFLLFVVAHQTRQGALEMQVFKSRADETGSPYGRALEDQSTTHIFFFQQGGFAGSIFHFFVGATKQNCVEARMQSQTSSDRKFERPEGHE